MPTPPGRPDGYLSLSDDELVDLARSDDSSAYGELWRRHSAIGTAIARRYYQVADPDDLVSESFARILSTMQRGGGPRSGFRPYLITTIGNVARRWAVQAREGATDQLDYLEDPKTLDDPLVASTDRELALTAFRSLPDRWQSVLWFSAVEGLGPRDVAANLGMTPNAAAVLAHRARNGLRTAWIQAHLNDATLDDECRWAAGRLGRHAAGALSSRERVRVTQHLRTCAVCQSRAKELDDLVAKLAAFLVAGLLGLSLTTIRPEGALTAGSVPPSSPAPPVTPSTPAVSASALSAPAVSGSAWLVSAVVAGVAAAAIAATVILPSTVAVETAPGGDRVDDKRATSSLLDTPATSAPPVPSDGAPTSPPEPPTDSPYSASVPAAPPAAPSVTSAIDPDGVRPPTLSGLALAGAQVLVFDDRGILISSVVADAAGAWSTGELAALSPAATALVVRQVDGSGATSPDTTLGGLAPRPLIAIPGYGNLEEPDVPFDLAVQGWPGALISVTFTAVEREGYVSPSTYLPTIVVLDASGNGVLTVDSSLIWYHRADLRYVDGDRVAASIRGHCFQVGMTYPGRPQGVPPLRCTA